MTARVVCVRCGSALTVHCLWGDADTYDTEDIDRQPAVPAGLLVKLEAEDAVPIPDRAGREIGRHVYSPAGAIAANPADIADDALRSTGVDNGCCGSDGCDGPNRACRCGAVVATEWSDCWTRAEVRFLPDAVTVLEN